MTRHWGRRAVKILIARLTRRAGLDRWLHYVEKPDKFEVDTVMSIEVGQPNGGIVTPDGVKLRIREAWDTLRRVPTKHVPGYRCAWPEIIRDYFEAYGTSAPTVRLEPAAPRAIDRMHETFGWFKFLNEYDLAQALWLTCGCGMGPRRASYILGVSRFTVMRNRDKALDLICAGLGTAGALQPFEPFDTSTVR